MEWPNWTFKNHKDCWRPITILGGSTGTSWLGTLYRVIGRARAGDRIAVYADWANDKRAHLFPSPQFRLYRSTNCADAIADLVRRATGYAHSSLRKYGKFTEGEISYDRKTGRYFERLAAANRYTVLEPREMYAGPLGVPWEHIR